MKRVEAMRRVNRIVAVLDWRISCPLPPYPHTQVAHWTDRIGPNLHSPMLGIEDERRLAAKEGGTR